MGRHISDETKKARGWGNIEGREEAYHTFRTIAETHSRGLSIQIWDWKSRRVIHTFSIAEAKVFYALRWNDHITEIREHVPMELAQTKEIADALGYCMSDDHNKIMTTDFLVVDDLGFKTAINVRSNRRKISSQSLHYAEIEKNYWQRSGAKWMKMFGEDIDDLFAMNVALVVQYYDDETVTDDYSLIKHLIATKAIHLRMDRFINYGALVKLLNKLESVEAFKETVEETVIYKRENILMDYDY